MCSSDLMARTSNTVLNKSDESGRPCPVPDLRGKAFSFSPLSMMLAVDVTYGLYYVEVWSLYTQVVESFYHKCVLNFFKCFFCIC